MGEGRTLGQGPASGGFQHLALNVIGLLRDFETFEQPAGARLMRNAAAEHVLRSHEHRALSRLTDRRLGPRSAILESLLESLLPVLVTEEAELLVLRRARESSRGLEQRLGLGEWDFVEQPSIVEEAAQQGSGLSNFVQRQRHGLALTTRRSKLSPWLEELERRQPLGRAVRPTLEGERLVLRATAGPILPHDGGATLFVWEGGADVYWGSYSFAGATLVRDPREGGLWSAPVRARFASERNDWLQFTVAPASKRTFGWAVDGKWRVLRAGVERNSRFDFTTRDNVIFTLGFERAIGGQTRD